MVFRRALLALATAALSLTLVAGAVADRPATKNERKAIAKILNMPPKCAKVRISTVTKRPKWATERFKPGPKVCDQVAHDGVGVFKKRKGRWRFVTAGSDFDCPRLYRKVPKRIAEDLGLDEWCH